MSLMQAKNLNDKWTYNLTHKHVVCLQPPNYFLVSDYNQQK